MSENSFDFIIQTPHQKIFSERITSLIAPGASGYFGVLAHHAPFLSTLAPGKISVRNAQGKTTTFQSKSSGILEAFHNQAVLLADQIE